MANVQDEFVEVGGGDFWGSKEDPLMPGDQIVGEYLNRQTDVGMNNATIYTLRTDEGDKSVWGSTMLDGRFDAIKLGNIVRVTYVGLSPKPGKYGKPFKVWKVEVKPNTNAQEPIVNASEVSELDDLGY